LCCGNLLRAVNAIGIQNQHLIEVAKRIQANTNPTFLVLGGHNHADRDFHSAALRLGVSLRSFVLVFSVLNQALRLMVKDSSESSSFAPKNACSIKPISAPANIKTGTIIKLSGQKICGEEAGGSMTDAA